VEKVEDDIRFSLYSGHVFDLFKTSFRQVRHLRLFSREAAS
jgi:hypothetical protein